MAGKHEMLQEINQFYTKYQHVMEDAGIKPVAFLKWAASFADNHAHMVKAHTFIFGTSKRKNFTPHCLLAKASVAHHYATEYPNQISDFAKAFAPGNCILALYRPALKNLKKVWVKRPPRIRGTE